MIYRLAPADPALGDKISHVIRDSDGACIPLDERNVDFQEFLRWNAEQEEPLIVYETESDE